MEELLTEHWEVFAFLISTIIGVGGSYVKLRHECEFIKGQMTQLMVCSEEIRISMKDMQAQIVCLQKADLKMEYDIKNCFDIIRRMEGECTNFSTRKYPKTPSD